MKLSARDSFIRPIIAFTVGRLPEDPGCASAPTTKKTMQETSSEIADTPTEGFKPIKTGYRLLAGKGSLALYEITLYTGGSSSDKSTSLHTSALLCSATENTALLPPNKRYGVFRQALCAYSLAFELPETSPLSYLNKTTIHAPAPEFERKFIGLYLKFSLIKANA